MEIEQCLILPKNGQIQKGIAIYLTPSEATEFLNDLDLAIGMKIKPRTLAEKLIIQLDKHLGGEA